MGYADEVYGDYASVEDVIDTAQHIPWSRAIVSLGAASVVSCSLTERSTEEETPITRAVSGPLCVCARYCRLRVLLETQPLHRYRDRKGGKYQKEIRGITVGRIATGQYGSEY